MSDIWIKIKFWTKATLITLLAIYGALFIYNNTGVSREVTFWWWIQKEPKTSVFVLAFLSFLTGIIATLLVRTTFTTMKQFRLLRAAKANRELAEMQTKAARLQTRSTNPPAPPSPSAAPDPTQL